MDISVIVPSYNRAELIPHTLESILGQSHKPAEVIVVDDGSTDQTEAVVLRYASTVRYLRINNSGECAARNAGVAASSAPWIAFCDSDDLWHPDRLALQVRLFKRAPDVEYAFTNFRTVVDDQWSTGTKFDSSPPGYWDLPRRNLDAQTFVVDCSMFSRLLHHQPIFPSSLMMKRSFFEAVGRWEEPLGRTRSVDLEFHLRCVDRPPVGVVTAPLVGIRKHAANFSGDELKNAVGELAVLRYVLEHNPAAHEHRDEIQEQIVLRSAMAAESAFAKGDMAAVRNLLQTVPATCQSWRLRLKGLIAHAPRPAGSCLRAFSLAFAAAARGKERQHVGGV